MATFTSKNYDGKSALQLQIEITESNWAADGSSSKVTAAYYFISVNQPVGAYTGDITSDYGTAQTVTCSLGSQSQIFNTNAFAIAAAIDHFGDKYLLGTISQTVKRSAAGTASIKASASCSLTWRSGYPSRSVTGTYVCTDTKHTVHYDGNGGSVVPGDQTKAYGTVLTLSSTKPTRSGYKFMGWATSVTGSVAYQPGGQYGADADITLYAIWRLTDITVTLTPVTIRIPATFVTGRYGFTYFYADPDYYVEIPYTYQFNGNISFATATPEGDSAQPLTGSSGVVRVPVGVMHPDGTGVSINIDFTFVTDGDTITVEKSVVCPLSDFYPFTVEPVDVHIDTENNFVVFKFIVQYPTSFNSSAIEGQNAFPLLVFNQTDALLSLSRQPINDHTMAVFVSVARGVLDGSGDIDIGYLGEIPVYGGWGIGIPTELDGGFTMGYPTTNKNIIICRDGTCQADQFIESDYIEGFFKGGCVVAGEFIELDDYSPVVREISTSEYYEDSPGTDKDRLTGILNRRVARAEIGNGEMKFYELKEV